MSQNSATIIVDQKEYKLKADIPLDVLNRAVELVNVRIAKYKKRSNRDELRATVMAAISLATEMSNNSGQIDEYETKIEDLEAELAFAKEEISLITQRVVNSLRESERVLQTTE